MEYKAHEISPSWPKVSLRRFNANLIPKKLEELAKAGVYFDSRIIS